MKASAVGSGFGTGGGWFRFSILSRDIEPMLQRTSRDPAGRYSRRRGGGSWQSTPSPRPAPCPRWRASGSGRAPAGRGSPPACGSPRASACTPWPSSPTGRCWPPRARAGAFPHAAWSARPVRRRPSRRQLRPAAARRPPEPGGRPTASRPTTSAAPPSFPPTGCSSSAIRGCVRSPVATFRRSTWRSSRTSRGAAGACPSRPLGCAGSAREAPPGSTGGRRMSRQKT